LTSIRILIAEDHTLVREGFRALLDAQEDFDVIAEASDGREAVQLALETQPDVVLMDISMPVMDGLEATRRIVKANAAIRVLVITAHDTEDYFFPVLEAGASGFIVKGAALTDLVAAVKSIHNGGVHLHPPLARRLLENYLQRVTTGEEESSYEVLSPREREVLQLIGAGYTNQEIASRLVLSINTVQTHRGRIMEKLDLHSRAELMKYTARIGAVRLPGQRTS
jgi:two-component system response regulator NreC